MMNGLKKAYVACLLLALSLGIGRAQILPGFYDIPFDGAISPVYDFNGDYSFSTPMIGAGGIPVDLSFGFPLEQTANGKVFGSGLVFVAVADQYFLAECTAKGKATGGGGKPNRLVLSVRLHGQDNVAGVDTRFRINVSYDLTVDSEAGNLVGSAHGKASFSELGSSKINTDGVVVTMPNPNGDWRFQANIIPLKKLAGSGAMVLSTGRALPGEVSGSYSAKSGEAKLTLTGVREGKGSKVTARVIPTEEGVELRAADGVVMGQRVRQ